MTFMKLRNALLILTLLTIPFALIEAYFQLTSSSPHELTRLQEKADTLNPCSFDEYVYPHPTMGYALKDKPDCKLKVSNLGAHGEDLPWEKKTDEFIIIVLGGSVAQQVTATFPPFRINQIEKHINRMFVAPENKHIRVINAAVPGWKQPAQIMQFISNVQRFDAFVSLEGYNEVDTITRDVDLEIPGFPYFLFTHLPDVNRWKMTTYHKAIEGIRRNKILKNSFLLNHIMITLKPLFLTEFLKSARASYLMRNAPVSLEKGISEYADNLRYLDAIARAHGKPGIVFLQPIASLRRGKYHERDWPDRKGIEGDKYQRVVNSLLALKLGFIKLESLIGIFEAERRWIYIDQVHSPVHMRTGYSVGYDILGKEIATRLGKHLKLKAKK